MSFEEWVKTLACCSDTISWHQTGRRPWSWPRTHIYLIYLYVSGSPGGAVKHWWGEGHLDFRTETQLRVRDRNRGRLSAKVVAIIPALVSVNKVWMSGVTGWWGAESLSLTDLLCFLSFCLLDAAWTFDVLIKAACDRKQTSVGAPVCGRLSRGGDAVVFSLTFCRISRCGETCLFASSEVWKPAGDNLLFFLFFPLSSSSSSIFLSAPLYPWNHFFLSPSYIRCKYFVFPPASVKFLCECLSPFFYLFINTFFSKFLVIYLSLFFLESSVPPSRVLLLHMQPEERMNI